MFIFEKLSLCLHPKFSSLDPTPVSCSQTVTGPEGELSFIKRSHVFETSSYLKEFRTLLRSEYILFHVIF